MGRQLTAEQARLLHERRVEIGRMGGRARNGLKSQKTLLLERAQRETKAIIANKAQELVRAGMVAALGQTFVYRIDEEQDDKGKITSRKHVRVTDPDEIARALDAMEEGGTDPDGAYYYVTAKEPEYKAIEMLFNRAFGKPKETLDVKTDVQFSLRELAKARASLVENAPRIYEITENKNALDSKEAGGQVGDREEDDGQSRGTLDEQSESGSERPCEIRGGEQ